MGEEGPSSSGFSPLLRAGKVSGWSWCLESHAQLQPVWQEGHLCPDLPLPRPVFARYVEEVAGGLLGRKGWLLGQLLGSPQSHEPVVGAVGNRSEL